MSPDWRRSLLIATVSLALLLAVAPLTRPVVGATYRGVGNLVMSHVLVGDGGRISFARAEPAEKPPDRKDDTWDTCVWLENPGKTRAKGRRLLSSTRMFHVPTSVYLALTLGLRRERFTRRRTAFLSLGFVGAHLIILGATFATFLRDFSDPGSPLQSFDMGETLAKVTDTVAAVIHHRPGTLYLIPALAWIIVFFESDG